MLHPTSQVFLCEQLLYNRLDLDRHNKTGDDAGPMAESGFKVGCCYVFLSALFRL